MMRRFLFSFPRLCSTYTDNTDVKPESQASSQQIDFYDSDEEEDDSSQPTKLQPTKLQPTKLQPPKYTMANTTPFIPPLMGGYVIQVSNENNIIIASKLPYNSSPVYRFQIGINGLNYFDNVTLQDALENLILHKDVTLKYLKTDKNGLFVADIYYKNTHISKWLVKNGFHMLEETMEGP